MEPDNRTKVTDGSQTLSRGLKLLSVIAEGHEGAPVRELSAAIGLPRSIVQRLLYSLEQEGFLERHPSHVGYQLSLKLWQLGCRALRRLSVREAARPHLEELAARCGEMIKLAILRGDEAIYIDGIESSRSLRAYVPIGGAAPAHLSATGKAILAFLPERSPGQNGGEKRSSKLLEDLQRIRQRGYAVNRGEWEDEIGAVAAPVFDAEGNVVASVGIILPLNRFPPAKAAHFGALTTAAAAEISRKLGFRPTEPHRTRVG